MKKHVFLASVVLTAAILLPPPSPGHRSSSGAWGFLLPACQADEPSTGDVERAGPLIRKKQAGETLTPEEQELANRVVTRAKELFRKKQSGETLTADEEQFLDRVRHEVQRGNQGQKKRGGKHPVSTTPVSDPKIVAALVPLDELTGSYKGQDGGLYGGGSNTPPAAHQAAYLAESQKICPLDASGKPSDSGKIVLMSIGMSNTTMEYSQFKKTADADPEKSPQVVVVDGAQGGKTGAAWAIDALAMLPLGEAQRLAKIMEERHLSGKKGLAVWSTAEERLKAQGVTPQQVQALWIKHAEARPAGLGDFPAHVQFLQADIVDTLNVAKQKYPNLRVAYLSSRIFAGYATTDLNPEPYAYEEAFAMRWVIQDQIRSNPRLNFDPAHGEVKAPIVVWGPYLWANGTTPRKSDGLVWKPDDVVTTDHTHPADSGRQKVADLLLKFLKTDAGARRWFVKQ